MGQDRELVEAALTEIGSIALHGAGGNGFIFYAHDVRRVLYKMFNASVAQLAQQRTCNAPFTSSTLVAGSKISEEQLDSIIEGCTKGNSHGEHGVPDRLHMDRIVSCLNKYFAGEWKPVLRGKCTTACPCGDPSKHCAGCSGASDDHNTVSKAVDAGSTPAAPATEVFIGEFADFDQKQGDAIDHSVRTGAPLFASFNQRMKEILDTVRELRCVEHRIPLNAQGRCSACDWWGHETRSTMQDLTKRDHLPEGSY